MFRQFRSASGWVAIVALLVNTVIAVAPAKAAQIVDNIQALPGVDAANGAEAFCNEGRKPAQPDTNCSRSALEQQLENGEDFGTACRHHTPPLRQAPRELTTPRLCTVDRLRVGGIGSRAPPSVT